MRIISERAGAKGARRQVGAPRNCESLFKLHACAARRPKNAAGVARETGNGDARPEARKRASLQLCFSCGDDFLGDTLAGPEIETR